MKHILLFITAFFSLSANADFRHGFFYVIEPSKYNEKMTPEQFWKTSDFVITCYDPRVRRPVCQEQTTILNQNLIINTVIETNGHFIDQKEKYFRSHCKVSEVLPSGVTNIIFQQVFSSYKDKPIISGQKYICGFSNGF